MKIIPTSPFVSGDPSAGARNESIPAGLSGPVSRPRKRADRIAVAVEVKVLGDLIPGDVEDSRSVGVVPAPGIHQRECLVRGIVTDHRIGVTVHDPN